MNRSFLAFAKGVAAAFVTAAVIFGVGIWMVRDSPDGQAGMGPALIAILIGGFAGLFVFLFSATRKP